MKKIFLILLPLILLAGVFYFSSKSQNEQIVVGVVVPMEHEALNQIVSGLREELSKETDKEIVLEVKNAQGDPNIQRAIVEQFTRDKCDLIIPIGTAAAQMTLNITKDQKVVCLAADSTIIPSLNRSLATALDDELSVEHSLSFLHCAFPKIKKITFLYSCSEKIAKEIPLVIQAATAQGIEVQKLMIQNLSELYTMSQAIAPDSEAIFILKDHLIVSGIQTIAQQAEKRKIPVMTSDEGSVIEGGAFAIGVKESNIGEQGAQMVLKILKDHSLESVPPEKINGPYPLFINREACHKQGIDLQSLVEDVREAGLPIHYVN